MLVVVSGPSGAGALKEPMTYGNDGACWRLSRFPGGGQAGTPGGWQGSLRGWLGLLGAGQGLWEGGGEEGKNI